jgi:hypothetical protein
MRFESIAEKRNRAHQNTDAKVRRHADERHVRQAADPCGERNQERKQAGKHVAEAGNESDERIKSETNVRAGNAEGFVE